MTVSSTVTRVTYTGNGVTTAFATTFPFFAASEIEVIERVIATGAETLKALTSHYTVSGGDGATGTVTAVGGAPSSSVQWVIRRKTARTQEIDYTPNDPFPAETHEEGLDRLKMNVQELGEENDRALKFPKTDAVGLSGEIPSSVARAGKFLTFDGDGMPTVAAGSADGLAVSPFMATVLDDADAAAARSTLGIGVSGLDITGLTPLTTPATNDELPIYDLSALANRKISVLDLFKALNALTAESAPATNDELMLWDVSEGAVNKMTFGSFLTVINGLTEDTTPDAANDFVVTYDASAGAAKKVKPGNLGAGGIGNYTVQAFTGSGNWTKPAGCKFIRVTCVGGGGSGADGFENFGSFSGGGGGAGGTAIKIINVQAISSIAVTVGGVGGTSSFGAQCSATGGSNGSGAAGGSGGGGSNGNINVQGGDGSCGSSDAGARSGGTGGTSHIGGGGRGGVLGGNGSVGKNYGGGGGGGGVSGGGEPTYGGGGTGAQGVVIVEEFS